jgi:hypothetical protein
MMREANSEISASTSAGWRRSSDPRTRGAFSRKPITFSITRSVVCKTLELERST